MMLGLPPEPPAVAVGDVSSHTVSGSSGARDRHGTSASFCAGMQRLDQAMRHSTRPWEKRCAPPSPRFLRTSSPGCLRWLVLVCLLSALLEFRDVFPIEVLGPHLVQWALRSSGTHAVVWDAMGRWPVVRARQFTHTSQRRSSLLPGVLAVAVESSRHPSAVSRPPRSKFADANGGGWTPYSTALSVPRGDSTVVFYNKTFLVIGGCLSSSCNMLSNAMDRVDPIEETVRSLPDLPIELTIKNGDLIRKVPLLFAGPRAAVAATVLEHTNIGRSAVGVSVVNSSDDVRELDDGSCERGAGRSTNRSCCCDEGRRPRSLATLATSAPRSPVRLLVVGPCMYYYPDRQGTVDEHSEVREQYNSIWRLSADLTTVDHQFDIPHSVGGSSETQAPPTGLVDSSSRTPYRANGTCVSQGQYIFIVGGVDMRYQSVLDSIDVYDAKNRKYYSDIITLKEAVINPLVAVDGNFLFVSSGDVLVTRKGALETPEAACKRYYSSYSSRNETDGQYNSHRGAELHRTAGRSDSNDDSDKQDENLMDFPLTTWCRSNHTTAFKLNYSKCSRSGDAICHPTAPKLQSFVDLPDNEALMDERERNGVAQSGIVAAIAKDDRMPLRDMVGGLPPVPYQRQGESLTLFGGQLYLSLNSSALSALNVEELLNNSTVDGGRVMSATPVRWQVQIGRPLPVMHYAAIAFPVPVGFFGTAHVHFALGGYADASRLGLLSAPGNSSFSLENLWRDVGFGTGRGSLNGSAKVFHRYSGASIPGTTPQKQPDGTVDETVRVSIQPQSEGTLRLSEDINCEGNAAGTVDAQILAMEDELTFANFFPNSTAPFIYVCFSNGPVRYSQESSVEQSSSTTTRTPDTNGTFRAGNSSEKEEAEVLLFTPITAFDPFAIVEPATDPDTKPGGGRLGIGAIIGIVAGTLGSVALLGVVGYLWLLPTLGYTRGGRRREPSRRGYFLWIDEDEIASPENEQTLLDKKNALLLNETVGANDSFAAGPHAAGLAGSPMWTDAMGRGLFKPPRAPGAVAECNLGLSPLVPEGVVPPACEVAQSFPLVAAPGLEQLPKPKAKTSRWQLGSFQPRTEKDHLVKNTTHDSRYSVVRRIGDGAFSSVYLVVRKHDGSRFAMKYMICYDNRQRLDAIRECETINSVQGHPNVIQLVDMFMNYEFGGSSDRGNPALGVRRDPVGAAFVRGAAAGSVKRLLPCSPGLPAGDTPLNRKPPDPSATPDAVNDTPPPTASKGPSGAASSSTQCREHWGAGAADAGEKKPRSSGSSQSTRNDTAPRSTLAGSVSLGQREQGMSGGADSTASGEPPVTLGAMPRHTALHSSAAPEAGAGERPPCLLSALSKGPPTAAVGLHTPNFSPTYPLPQAGPQEWRSGRGGGTVVGRGVARTTTELPGQHFRGMGSGPVSGVAPQPLSAPYYRNYPVPTAARDANEESVTTQDTDTCPVLQPVAGGAGAGGHPGYTPAIFSTEALQRFIAYTHPQYYNQLKQKYTSRDSTFSPPTAASPHVRPTSGHPASDRSPSSVSSSSSSAKTASSGLHASRRTLHVPVTAARKSSGTERMQGSATEVQPWRSPSTLPRVPEGFTWPAPAPPTSGSGGHREPPAMVTKPPAPIIGPARASYAPARFVTPSAMAPHYTNFNSALGHHEDGAMSPANTAAGTVTYPPSNPTAALGPGAVLQQVTQRAPNAPVQLNSPVAESVSRVAAVSSSTLTQAHHGAFLPEGSSGLAAPLRLNVGDGEVVNVSDPVNGHDEGLVLAPKAAVIIPRETPQSTDAHGEEAVQQSLDDVALASPPSADVLLGSPPGSLSGPSLPIHTRYLCLVMEYHPAGDLCHYVLRHSYQKNIQQRARRKRVGAAGARGDRRGPQRAAAVVVPECPPEVVFQRGWVEGTINPRVMTLGPDEGSALVFSDDAYTTTAVTMTHSGKPSSVFHSGAQESSFPRQAGRDDKGGGVEADAAANDGESSLSHGDTAAEASNCGGDDDDDGSDVDDDPTALNAMTEDQLLSVAYQLASVLHHLHSQRPPIVHRDLKPENILIRGGADDAIFGSDSTDRSLQDDLSSYDSSGSDGNGEGDEDDDDEDAIPLCGPRAVRHREGHGAGAGAPSDSDESAEVASLLGCKGGCGGEVQPPGTAERQRRVRHRERMPRAKRRVRSRVIPIVVTDFGLAFVQEANRKSGRGGGTKPYISPESWKGQTTTCSDVWAMGCVLYALATERLTVSTVRIMSQEAKREGFASMILKDIIECHYSLAFASFVVSLLVVDPKKRPTADMLRQCFKVEHTPRRRPRRRSGGGSSASDVEMEDVVRFDFNCAFFMNVQDL